MTAIEWVRNPDGSQGRTWNPIVGCSVVSPGCTNCYAMAMAARLERMGLDRYVGLTRPSKAGPVWTGETRLVEDTLTEPLRRRKPTTWFVNSMSDLFHESVPDAWIDRVFAVMALAPQHTFQVLTKRSARMRAYMADPARIMRLRATTLDAARKFQRGRPSWGYAEANAVLSRGPLPNVWLGVSTEDQRRADDRVPDLLATPVAVRFVSAEPLLGPIDFTRLFFVNGNGGAGRYNALTGEWRPGDIAAMADHGGPRLDQIIVGGESGPDARLMHPAWVRTIRDQCAAAGTAFFFKQWGAWAPTAKATIAGDIVVWPNGRTDCGNANEGGGGGRDMIRVGKRAAGRLLDGLTHDGMPAGVGGAR